MSSSEIKDSGKVSGHKSNFSQTCTLLSQYLREKGSFGDLSLGLSPNFQQHGTSSLTSPKTKNLLPMIEKAGQNTGAATHDQAKTEPERSQMTIFFGGQVIVFNDFPADKAKEIMGFAGKAGSQNPNTYTTTTMVQKPPESASNVVPGPRSAQSSSQPLANNDLPIMRNASLARFFEKRKDRITARAPYQMRNTMEATSKPDDNKAWLGLGSQSQDQNGRQL